jgi:hypothetical protein
MKLFRAFNAHLDPGQPLIQWEGDVRGIIAGRRAAELNARLRLRIAGRTQRVAPVALVKTRQPMEIAA